ncbi:rod shape-determining protein [Paenibacillus validus]|uniref:Cell shape-determining protein MreB n=1 Tax=Paenibacillus validus TaxID=44253 RepID=A0A7X2ZBS9_9BACL|nr:MULTISPECIES: rod shape-determining protein [Paenibacillus]MED4599400.1 rod shape-determining protein [Paenibacillus validus]MED4605112.1 rod shape-determining protein [Paenibacillus validus]MUG72033.1 MreB/Mrl family cell shape determining protein [Paenibacillus validus]
MFKRFDKLYGIDLGTSNTVIFEQGKGIVLSEPSVVAFHQSTGELLAVGAEAQAMIGRAPAHVDITYPLRNGVIANFDLTSSMLQHFIKKIQGRSSLLRSSQVYISVPCGITNVQKRAVEETIVHKGAKRAIAVEEPLAAALGAGLPIDEPIGHLVLDIGGGSCQVAILSLGGIVASHTVNRAGMSLDLDIMDYVKRQYNLEIGERTAEEIKKQIGTARASSEERTLGIKGRDVINGLPRSIQLSSREIYTVVDDFLQLLVEAIRATLERCPPELAGDVVEQGILLCGGGALLEGIDERIREETGVPVHIAEHPLECTALGTGMMLGAHNSKRVPAWREAKPESAVQQDAGQQAEM